MLGRKLLPAPVKPRQQSCWRPLWSWCMLTMVNVLQELKGTYDYLFLNRLISLVNLRSTGIKSIWWPMNASSTGKNHKHLKYAEMTCKRTDIHLYDGFYLVYVLVKEVYFLTCKRNKTYCQGQSETKIEGSKICSHPAFFMLVRTTVPHKKANKMVPKPNPHFLTEGWQSFLLKQWSEISCPDLPQNKCTKSLKPQFTSTSFKTFVCLVHLHNWTAQRSELLNWKFLTTLNKSKRKRLSLKD